MRHITKEQLIQQTKQYYNNNKLQFQKDNPECILVDENNYRCPIGAALKENEIEQLYALNYTPEDLEHQEIVRFTNMNFANTLQQIHDQMVRAKILKEPLEDKIRKFESLIGA
jgi:hypothetical protein